MIRRIVALGVMMVMACAAVSHAELIGYWPLDDGSGDTVVDASGSGNNMTIDPENEDAVSWSEDGYQGGALSFSTVFASYSYVEASIPEGTLDMEEVTLAFWMNMPADYQAWGIVVDLISSDYDYSLEATDAGVLYMYDPWFGDDSSVMNDGQWHHVALTSDGDEIVIYIDGEEGATSSTSLSDEIETVRIGGPREYVSVWASYTGLLDEVALFNEPLSAGDIADLYANGLSTDPMASKPSPTNEQDDVAPYATLSWTPVTSAESRDVYFGTDAEDVAAATVENPLGVLVSQGQSETTYQPESLDLGQTYYWRVDEVNEDDTILVGNLWSFTVEPVAFVMDANTITATASSSDSDCGGPQATVDANGLNADDKHNLRKNDMWLTTGNDATPWIEYAFDGVYALDQMQIWNYNVSMEYALGLGVQEALIEVSTDGATWIVVEPNLLIEQANGRTPTPVNAELDLGGLLASHVRITPLSNWSSIGLADFGLSEVRFTWIPMKARLPEPDDDATDVAVDEVLAWRSGRLASEHEVYLGTDAESLTLTATVTEPTFAPADLLYNETYFWRVDEVNDAADPVRHEGDLWSFSTSEYLVIDDMESYGNANYIFNTWADGYEDQDDDNSSQVGHDDPPYVEQDFAYAGEQSMPLYYTNEDSGMYAEAVMTLDGADWSIGGAETLVLYVMGDAGNEGGTLYVKVNNKKVTSDLDLTFGLWTQLDIALADFNTNLSDVTSLTIGIDGAGEGMVTIDEVRLYRQAPTVAEPSDPGSDGLVAYWAMDDGSGYDVTDSAGSNHGTIDGFPSWTDGYLGGALSLDGISDFVDFGAGAAFDLTGTITLSAWVKTADSGNSDHNPFVGKGDTAYALKHGSGNSFEFYVYEDSSWYTAYSSVGEVYNDAWHHVAGTFDGSQVKLYIDGVLRSTTDHEGGISTNTYEVNMGRNSQETDRFYEGLIDEVRLFDRALTAGEVRFLAGDE